MALLSFFVLDLWGNIGLIYLRSEQQDSHHFSSYCFEKTFCQAGWNWVVARFGCRDISVHSCNCTWDAFGFKFSLLKSMVYWTSESTGIHSRLVFYIFTSSNLFTYSQSESLYFYCWTFGGRGRGRCPGFVGLTKNGQAISVSFSCRHWPQSFKLRSIKLWPSGKIY